LYRLKKYKLVVDVTPRPEHRPTLSLVQLNAYAELSTNYATVE